MRSLRNDVFRVVAIMVGLVAFAFAAPNAFVVLPATSSQFSSSIRPAPSYVDARVLAANTAESQTVPTGARFVLFSSTCNFYANPTTTATVPADTTNGSASELNPSAWFVGPPASVATISVIADVACVITFSFYN